MASTCRKEKKSKRRRVQALMQLAIEAPEEEDEENRVL